MLKRFTFAREDCPGDAWLARFVVGRDEAEHWYLGKGRASAPTSAECRMALQHHMPELMPPYDRVCELVGDDHRAHQILSQYRPPPLAAGWIIAQAQRPWGGCVDGINEDGLVASCTFGGSPAMGAGFSVILILRYVLEVCRDVNEAILALRRIPIAQSHNVTLLDRTGA